MPKRPRILVVNDDGLHGPGLKPLIGAMRRVGDVTVVVPNQERSADSHCLTLHKPIRVHRVEKDLYALNGSPADCARFGILEILRSRVDLVASGINNGYNLGEDVVYSGTVAAAMEAALLEVPALAFSQEWTEEGPYARAAAFAQSFARLTLKRDIPRGICLNVNFPSPSGGPFKKALAARLGRRIYSQDVTRREDPRGGAYYWLAGKTVKGVKSAGTDVTAVATGHVAITPLNIDNTDRPMLESLKSWGF